MFLARTRGILKLRSAVLLCAILSLASVALAQHAPARRRVIHRVQYGTASWYGSKSQGHLMACGEPFNEHDMIAAHRTLPLGTRVRVTNLRNGRSVIVRIRDRGPWIGNRIIDLSRAAARRLGFTGQGLAPVRVRVLSVPPSHRGRSTARETGSNPAASSARSVRRRQIAGTLPPQSGLN
ncbi:MAG: septal ring lytic transglycosylase RlpA family protein [Terriglobia bacterium]